MTIGVVVGVAMMTGTVIAVWVDSNCTIPVRVALGIVAALLVVVGVAVLVQSHIVSWW